MESSDRNYSVGIMGGIPSPDTDVVLHDYKNNQREALLATGPGSIFDSVFWLDNEKFVVTGFGEYYPVGNNKRCSVGEICTYAFDIYLFDVEARTKTVYESQEFSEYEAYWIREVFVDEYYKSLGEERPRFFTGPDEHAQYNPEYFLGEEVKVCLTDEHLNFDKPNTTAKYESKEKGISMEIPYNQAWGSKYNKLNPFDEYEYEPQDEFETGQALLFGPVYSWQGCAWLRTELKFLPAKSAEQVIAELEEWEELDPPAIAFGEIRPEVIKINNLEVVKYVGVNLALGDTSLTLEVIGKKYNYEINSFRDYWDFDSLEEVVKSIELID